DYTITLYGKDVFGNTNSCVSKVFVRDNTPPISTCPNNATISRPSNSCFATTGTCDTHFGGFLSTYAPERIEEIKIHSNGNVDFSNAPNSVTVYDSDNGTSIPGFTAMRIRVACAGIGYHFTWTY